MPDESLIEQIVEKATGDTPQSEETGNCLHRIAAIGCYTLAVALALLAMGALWTWVYKPTQFVREIVIGSVTGLACVVFLWALFIKKW